MTILRICNTRTEFEHLTDLLNEGFFFISEPIKTDLGIIFFLNERQEEKHYKQVAYRMVNSHDETTINNLLKLGYVIKNKTKDYIQLIKEVQV